MPEIGRMQIDKTINYGHILQALTIVIAVCGSILYGVRTNERTLLQIASIQISVDAMVPKVSALEAANALNTERLTNHANSIRSAREDVNQSINDLRRTDGQMQLEINTNRVDIAGIKGRERDK